MTTSSPRALVVVYIGRLGSRSVRFSMRGEGGARTCWQQFANCQNIYFCKILFGQSLFHTMTNISPYAVGRRVYWKKPSCRRCCFSPGFSIQFGSWNSALGPGLSLSDSPFAPHLTDVYQRIWNLEIMFYYIRPGGMVLMIT